MPLKVLVVCLGNICRSPIGEAVLRQVASERGVDIEVDSAGTGAYHVGEEPDERSIATCEKHGVPISHAARQVKASDFDKFTHILAADESNLRNLERIRPRNSTADLKLWGSYASGNKPIADPYYGGINGFETTFVQCQKLSHAFLDAIVGKQEPETSSL
ncbi:phosphotyrosine protein phosphatase [Stereum hirsutum FP-91666 SS1]|uniref:phosphotyrosine protein phosphatase n=1 Tax=Stereum hirsutum (strain FP-91666) TaxID=721885 RepID=UPI000440C7C3|nr:phosphotyrosine protein phosphatase [Stereum hirsutum FP-91666 SS1]EIM92144.1 phosphotyrosine protein phosphatase [Stereum hirsutum FP-91666 SS1]